MQEVTRIDTRHDVRYGSDVTTFDKTSQTIQATDDQRHFKPSFDYEDILSAKRSGNDLFLHLDNGEVVQIVDYFLYESYLVIPREAGSGGLIFGALGALALGALGMGGGGSDDDPDNAAPTVSDQSAITAEPTETQAGEPISGTLADSVTDPEGDPITFSTSSSPAGFSIEEDGSWTFDPSHPSYNHLAEGASEVLTIPYTATDSDGNSATANLAITITGTNDAPVAVADENTGPQSGTVTGSVAGNDTDVDDNAVLTYALGTPPAPAGVSAAAAQVGISNAAVQPGTSSAAATSTSVPGLVFNADGSYSFDPTQNPTLIALPAGEVGEIVVDYYVTDEHGATNTSTLTFKIIGVNDAPEADALNLTVTEDSADNAGLLTATDVDTNDTLTFSAGFSENGTVTLTDPATGAFVYTPNEGFFGNDSFTYTVEDAAGATDTQTVYITVTPVNDAPIASDESLVTDEDTQISGNLPAATDADGDAVSYDLATAATNGVASVNIDGSYVYTPNAGYNGDDSFSYTVDDGKGGTNTYTVDVTVNNVNDAPVAADANGTTPEDTPLAGVALPAASDADGDAPLTYTLETGATNGTVTVDAAGTYDYDPNPGYNGNDSFTYTVADGNGGENTYTVNLSVTAVNDLPVSSGTSVSTDEDTALSGNLPTASDADGDSPITYSAGATAPANGSVSIGSDGSYTYTPNPGYNGPDSFTFLVNDGTADSASEYTVAVTVNNVNDAPIAEDANGTTAEGVALVGEVLPAATDADNDDVTYKLETGAANGTVTVDSTGTYDYTPNENYNGNDSFTYTVEDGNGGENTYTVNLVVTPVNMLRVRLTRRRGLFRLVRMGHIPTRQTRMRQALTALASW